MAEPGISGSGHGRGAIGDVQLGEHVGDVIADGLARYDKPGGDRLQPAGDLLAVGALEQVAASSGSPYTSRFTMARTRRCVRPSAMRSSTSMAATTHRNQCGSSQWLESALRN
jgi:hypothetical protein